ncbi:MAG: glycosyltransferase [Chloroflexi bacterium]|nr:glycosyltransferase [Chloroflexota bacterium]
MRILWIPHASWSTPQRARLLSEALAARHEVHVTDWVADFRHAKDVLTSKYWKNYIPRNWTENGVRVHHVPRITPALYVKGLRQINERIYSHYIENIIQRFKIETVLGTYVAPPPRRGPRLIFDCFDNNPAYWREVIKYPSYADEIEETESEYARVSDAVITVSHVLRDKMLPLVPASRADQVSVLPNPVDMRKYRQADGEAMRRRYGFENKKVIGIGGLYAPFSGLLRFIEAANLLRDPNYVFLVVGFGELLEPAKQRAAELGLTNVIFTGRVPGEDIPAYYKAMDVPVLPFDRNGFTHAACLIKMLDFSAANKRFVATDLEEIQRVGFPNVVLADDTPHGIAVGIQEALANPWTGDNDFLLDYDTPNVIRRVETILSGQSE